MTWLDIVLIVICFMFLALGARLGSVLTSALIIGGFLGAALVDYYTLPLVEFLGGFSGASIVAGILLYLLGLLVILIPGFILSKIGSNIFMKLIDGTCGLFTGAFAGLFFLGFLLILVMPHVPQFEQSEAFRQSSLVKPFQMILEEMFSNVTFQAPPVEKRIKEETLDKLAPLTKKAESSLSDLKSEIEKKLN